MSMLRTLGQRLWGPAVAYGQLPTIAAEFRTGFGPGQGVAQQCCSLLSFVSRQFGSRSEGSRLALGSPASQQLGQLRQSTASLISSRGFASKGLVPRFTGGKLKPYSSYKERFKMTGSGKIRYMRPGAVHKHFNKGNRQNRDLSKTKVLYETYAKTMRRLGFKMRSF